MMFIHIIKTLTRSDLYACDTDERRRIFLLLFSLYRHVNFLSQMTQKKLYVIKKLIYHHLRLQNLPYFIHYVLSQIYYKLNALLRQVHQEYTSSKGSN